MPRIITESHVEENVSDILKNLSYEIIRKDIPDSVKECGFWGGKKKKLQNQ